jgi:hypothetical protein
VPGAGRNFFFQPQRFQGIKQVADHIHNSGQAPGMSLPDLVHRFIFEVSLKVQ